MNILRGLAEAAAFRGAYVSIGNFDGVHCGHRSMLATLTGRARAARRPALVFTFDPHPIALLRPQQTPPPLTTTQRRLELLAESGVDATLVYATDQALLNLSPQNFFDRIIVGQLAARGLVEGPNFYFGHDRAGTIATLKEYCGQAAIDLEIVPPVIVDDLLVSSSEIRRLIARGEVRRAGKLLGAPYRLSGTVVGGARRGRTIGFPTANLADVRTLLPRDGVYAGRALVDSTWFAAAINVGANPTFSESERKVEAHLIDFEGDLYDRALEVEFLERLRDTAQFAGPAELKRQLSRDVKQARDLSARSPAL
ncbi:MAG: bifunctional riboflavin kinase/FAD synthetase [Planctomycetaceae bacterium]